MKRHLFWRSKSPTAPFRLQLSDTFLHVSPSSTPPAFLFLSVSAVCCRLSVSLSVCLFVSVIMNRYSVIKASDLVSMRDYYVGRNAVLGRWLSPFFSFLESGVDWRFNRPPFNWFSWNNHCLIISRSLLVLSSCHPVRTKLSIKFSSDEVTKLSDPKKYPMPFSL